MRGVLLRPISGLVAVLLVSSAQAALISVNSGAYGPGSFTHDTATGLYWLDITETAGYSGNSISANLGAGGAFEGLRRATDTEVQQLWTNAGLTYSWPDSSRVWTTGNYSPAANLQQLMGITNTFTSTNVDYDGANFHGAFYLRDGTTDYHYAAYMYANPNTGKGTYDTRTGLSTSSSYSNIGTYLVTSATPVPVPAALWLFGSAIGLLGWIRRRAE